MSTNGNSRSPSNTADPAGPDEIDPAANGGTGPAARPPKDEYDLEIEQYTRQLAGVVANPWVLYNNRAIAWYQKGERHKALADLNKAIELKPDFADAYHTRGIVYSSLGEQGKADADFARSRELQR